VVSSLAESDIHELAQRMRDLSVWLDCGEGFVAEYEFTLP